jgi:branched-chain amino acid transport system permease protein
MLRAFSDYRMVVYSLALVLMMIFRPKGLMGTYDFSMGDSIEKIVNRFRSKKEVKK